MLATPKIRPATPADRDVALELICEYLLYMQRMGSEVVPSNRTLSFYGGVFDAYVNGHEEGAVLVADAHGKIVGLTMAGHTMPFDTVYGKTATGWFTYVTADTRGHGTGTLLRSHLRDSLRTLGYRAIAAGYHTWNASSQRFVEQRGFKSLQVYGIETLTPDSELHEGEGT